MASPAKNLSPATSLDQRGPGTAVIPGTLVSGIYPTIFISLVGQSITKFEIPAYIAGDMIRYSCVPFEIDKFISSRHIANMFMDPGTRKRPRQGQLWPRTR